MSNRVGRGENVDRGVSLSPPASWTRPGDGNFTNKIIIVVDIPC